MTDARLLGRADELRSGRTPFVLATVVRAERPGARPGDAALVLPDGTVEGFVGDGNAESTTRLEGLRMLREGGSGLLRITPTAPDAPATADGGGTLEIFLESVLPPPLVAVFGDGPVAIALVQVGEALDHEVRTGTDPVAPLAPDTAAVVVASHGRDEPEVLAAALHAGVPYVALVAGPRRARGVLAELACLGIPPEQRNRVRAPAGLDIGARTAPQIALSIYAEMVARRALQGAPLVPALLPAAVAHLAAAAGPGAAPAPVATRIGEAPDPVCGVTVTLGPTALRVDHAGHPVWFCGPGCRQAFLDAPGRYRDD